MSDGAPRRARVEAVAAQPGCASAAAAAAARASAAPALATCGDDLLGARVDHVEALPALGGAPLAADEQIGAERVVSHARCSTRPTGTGAAAARPGRNGGDHQDRAAPAAGSTKPRCRKPERDDQRSRRSRTRSTSKPSNPVASQRSSGSVSAANRAASASTAISRPPTTNVTSTMRVKNPESRPSSAVRRRRLAACSASGGSVEQLLAAHGGADDDRAGHGHAAGLQRQHPAADHRPTRAAWRAAR